MLIEALKVPFDKENIYYATIAYVCTYYATNSKDNIDEIFGILLTFLFILTCLSVFEITFTRCFRKYLF